MRSAMEEVEAKGNFNTRAISSTLRFLKQNGVQVANRFPGDKAPEQLVELIKDELVSRDTKSIIVYTDGSTNPQTCKFGLQRCYY